MSGNTAIEWTNKTWNPLAGCTKVSAGCEHCYAFALHDQRHTFYVNNNGIYPTTGRPVPKQYAKPFSEIQLIPQRLEDPLHWRTPQRIFVNSMSDLFHSRVPDDYIFQVFQTMNRAHWHTFQVLTKRPGRLRRLAPSLPWSSNIGMGVSIESDVFCARADVLRDLPPTAGYGFLSCEPLLGPLPSLNLRGINQVIVGGESGKDARPCDPAWVRGIRDQCLNENVAFFFKQWGGKTAKTGGRELDGTIWNEFPR